MWLYLLACTKGGPGIGSDRGPALDTAEARDLSAWVETSGVIACADPQARAQGAAEDLALQGVEALDGTGVTKNVENTMEIQYFCQVFGACGAYLLLHYKCIPIRNVSHKMYYVPLKSILHS